MALNGIDISNWQSGINLAAVPADFVICKATEGTGYVSPDFTRQMNQASSAGKRIGAYHYANGGNVQAEADHFINQVKPYLGKAILALDWEAQNNAGWANNDFAWCKSFCDYVTSKTGIKPLIYIQQSAMNRLDGVGYGLWVAQYADMNPTGYQEHPWNEGSYSCVMRQYASTGRLDGYGSNLDLDKFYGDGAAWDKYAGGGVAVNPTPAESAPAPVETPTTSGTVYTVKSGDTLSGIAAQYGTTYQHLAEINGIANPNLIYPGQQIRIDGVSAPTSSGTVYTVKSGDTLSGIAAQYGTTYQQLAAINGIANPDLIYPGQQIKIG